MAAINQRIPNFLGGVSQQPDSIKFPGQLRVCDNALPDVTFGLKKRPPAEFLSKLTGPTSTGQWFDIVRDGDEKFLVQIQASTNNNNEIKVWALTDIPAGLYGNNAIAAGTEIPVNARNAADTGSGTFNYLTQANGVVNNFAVHTIQDNTIIANPETSIKASDDGVDNTDASNWNAAKHQPKSLHNGNYAFARLDTVAYNTEYIIWDKNSNGGAIPQPRKMRRITALKARVHSVAANIADMEYSGSTPIDVHGQTVVGQMTFAIKNVVTEDNDVGEMVLTNVQQGLSGQKMSGDVNLTTNTNGRRGECRYTLLVNGYSYIYKVKETYDDSGSGNASDFIGHSSRYATRYTPTIVMKDGGRYAAHTNYNFTTGATSGGNNLNQTGANLTTALNGRTDPGYIEKGTVIDHVDIEGITWEVYVDDYDEFDTYEGVPKIAYYKTPKNPDDGSLSMGSILAGLHASTKISQSGAYTDQPYLEHVKGTVAGNGLYLYNDAGNDSPASVSFLGGAVNEGMTVIGRTAPDISKLPSQCKNGYIVQVSNSEETDIDNYYLKFQCDGTVDVGPGKWIECAKPSDHGLGGTKLQTLGLDGTTMPHVLRNNRDGTFTFKPLPSPKDTTNYINDDSETFEWKVRKAGSVSTNPLPTFVDKKISQIFFMRKRLGFIANEQIVLSKPNDFFNFFNTSVISTSEGDVIDMSISDTRPANIKHTLPVPQGQMIFSENSQFLLGTENDVFSPITARLRKISNYECDANISPVDMGTSVMWASTVGPYSRTHEAVIVERDAPPRIIEQTRVVPEFLPNDITAVTNSSVLGMVTYGKRGNSNLFHYKYFDQGDQRSQSAWFSWSLTGTLQHLLYSGGNLYTITLQGSDYIFSRHEFITNATAARSYTLGTGTVGSPTATSRWFEACLDSMVIPSAISYTAQGASVTGPDFTDLTLGYTPTSADNFYAVGLSGTDTEGNDVAGTVVKATSVGTNKATFEGIDMTGWTVAVGYKYTTIVELPNYYPAAGENVYDIDADLRISGINFEMGVSGPMEFHISSEYADMDDFIQYESGMKLDDSDFGKPPAKLMKSVRVPIQKKNEKYKLQIQIPDPFSTALISASWDGRYNTRRHVRK